MRFHHWLGDFSPLHVQTRQTHHPGQGDVDLTIVKRIAQLHLWGVSEVEEGVHEVLEVYSSVY